MASIRIFSNEYIKLYPSVYVPEGLEILKTKLRYDRKLHERTDLSRQELLTLTQLCVFEPYFECELGTFIQDEGAPMGGPLSDLLADLIIENKIEKAIAEHPRWGSLVDWKVKEGHDLCFKKCILAEPTAT